MSYTIHIINRKSKKPILLQSKHNIEGGTYCVGGTSEAVLNITYNYAKWFYKMWPEPKSKSKKDVQSPFGQMFGGNDGGIRSLYGKTLDTVISELEKAIFKLKGKPNADYWKATEGNARQSLFNLKMLCEMARFENPKADLTLKGD